MIPPCLHGLSICILVLGACCAVVIASDVLLHPQRMRIMDVVWPVTALFGTVGTAWMYFRYGRLAAREPMQPARQELPFPIMVAKGASHCGSGCCIGDICAEWLAFVAPSVAVWFGWQSIFSEKMFAVWLLDFVFAFILGVAFQYFTIVPMRHLGKLEGVWQALKADALSLTAWQIGMYGFMAIAKFWLFATVLGAPLNVDTPEFWFMMQIAMVCGFATSYPVNWWLLKSGIKEKM